MKVYYVKNKFVNAEGKVDLVQVIQGNIQDIHHSKSFYPESIFVESHWKITNILSVLVQQELRSYTVFVERTYKEFGEQKIECRKIRQGRYDGLLEQMFTLQKGDMFVVHKNEFIVIQPTLENWLKYGSCESKAPEWDAIFQAAQHACER